MESDCLRAAENDRPDDPTKTRDLANPVGLPGKVDLPDRNQTDRVPANLDRRRADCLLAAESDYLHAAESDCLRAAENARPDDPTKIRVPANPACLPEKVDRPGRNQTDLVRANPDRRRADCLRAAENDRPDDPTKIRVLANPVGLPGKVDHPDRNQIAHARANLDRRRAAENSCPNDAAKNCLRANPVGLPGKVDRPDRNQIDRVRANPDRRRAAESDCLRAAENDRPDDPTKSRVRDRRRAPRSGRAEAHRNRRAS